jgi:hypothetical protein
LISVFSRISKSVCSHNAAGNTRRDTERREWCARLRERNMRVAHGLARVHGAQAATAHAPSCPVAAPVRTSSRVCRAGREEEEDGLTVSDATLRVFRVKRKSHTPPRPAAGWWGGCVGRGSPDWVPLPSVCALAVDISPQWSDAASSHCRSRTRRGELRGQPSFAHHRARVRAIAGIAKPPTPTWRKMTEFSQMMRLSCRLWR